MQGSAKRRKRTESSKIGTRATLIAAAIEEFSERGLRQPSLDDICARAGYTRGAFYVHFADREALIVAVMDEVLGQFVANLLTGQSAASGDLIDTIRSYMRAAKSEELALRGTKSVRFHHLVEACRSFPAVGDRYRSIVHGARDLIAAAVQAGQAQGKIRRDVAAGQLTDLLVAAAIGIAVSVDLEVAIDELALGETLIALLAA